jgi:pyruvate formate lyase activating enzyme
MSRHVPCSASRPANSTPALLADTAPFSFVDGPGNRFVAFFQGCTFDCVACHNPQTIPQLVLPTCRAVTVPELVAEVRAVAPYLRGITASGGECTLQASFVVQWFAALAADDELSRLTRFVDSNGDADPATWDALDGVMDAAMLDLKAFDREVHERITGRSNARVLASIELLAGRGQLHEVRLLIIPGVTDKPDLLGRTATWLHDTAPGVPVVLLPFGHHGVRAAGRTWREATAADLERVAAVLALAAPLTVRTVSPLTEPAA